jgi:hypothetical protein
MNSPQKEIWPRIILRRFAYTPMGTFGHLIMLGNEFECYTVERPWKDNQPEISCIPEGNYELVLGRFNKGGYPAYEFVEVPGREYIKIHIANTMDDVLGCIGLGSSLGFVQGKWAVTLSSRAHTQFMRAMHDSRTAWIEIKSVFGDVGKSETLT